MVDDLSDTPHGPPALSIAARFPGLRDALDDEAERRALERQLPPYLQAQRWFGGRTRRLREARIERRLPLRLGIGAARPPVAPSAGLGAAGSCATGFGWGTRSRESGEQAPVLCVVAATDEGGARTEHQLWLTADEGVADGGRRAVRDALADEATRARLLALLGAAGGCDGGRQVGQGVELVCEPTGSSIFDLPSSIHTESRLVGAEQSNTSIVYGEAAILKVYRRLERGPNPEVELGRFLTAEAGFDATPRLIATGRLRGADGFAADALLLQEFVPNRGDGWTWALAGARAALDATSDPDALAAWLDREGTTLADAAALGAVTARLHAALAGATGAALRPRPATATDAREWVAAVRREAAGAAGALGRAGIGDPALRSALGRAGAIAPPPADDAGLLLRVHGDYHLGQVLATEAGFAILDFEGEPARPLAERRRRRHPLVDVAGMVRSWNYAAATAAGQGAAGGGRGGEEAARRARAARWEAAVRGRFLAAYWAAADAGGAGFLPRTDAGRAALLRLFELQKALYEVQYELDYRPGLVGIPAAAVQRLV